MRQKKLFAAAVVITALIAAAIQLITPVFSYAGTAFYLYDDNGRLIKAVTSAGDAVIYEYDKVGNLTSMTRESIRRTPPAISNVIHDVVFRGTTVSMTIAGENLFSTSRIFSNHSGVIVNAFKSSDTVINTTITISDEAPLGSALISIETLYGTTSISITVADLIFSERQTAIISGAAANIIARTEPGLSKDLTVTLYNQNPDIISAPLSLTVPAGGSSILTINALKEGVGIISSENAWLIIYVTQPLTGSVSASTMPVSVIVKQAFQGITTSVPVSVGILPSPVQGIATSSPVSVKVLSSISGPIVSNIVSVKIQKQ